MKIDFFYSKNLMIFLSEKARTKAFAKDISSNQERKSGARTRLDTKLVSTINDDCISSAIHKKHEEYFEAYLSHKGLVHSFSHEYVPRDTFLLRFGDRYGGSV